MFTEENVIFYLIRKFDHSEGSQKQFLQVSGSIFMILEESVCHGASRIAVKHGAIHNYVDPLED